MTRRSGHRAAPTAVLAAVCASLLALPASLLAQTTDRYPEFEFDGQFRLRGEADGRTVEQDADLVTLSRIRVGATARLMDWIRVYAQVQDARAWGTEAGTLDGDADQLDLHQGYVEFRGSGALAARLGRQRMPLADERLVGAVEWSNVGRIFDGVRVLGQDAGVNWTVFWYNVAERDAVLPVGPDPQLNEGLNDDGWLLGGFAAREFGDVTSELTLLHDRDAATDESWTANLRVLGDYRRVSYEAAAAYQFGPDRSAWFASARLELPMDRGGLAAQLDYLSGDDDLADGETKAFNTLYATNHKFYGYMDYFLALPAQLAGAGLVDLILRGRLETSANTVLRADLHRFFTPEERLDQRGLGTELDLVGRWGFAPPGHLELGLSVFAPDDLATILLPAFANGESTTWWGYAQLVLSWP